MTSNEFAAMLKRHVKWRADPTKGRRANLRGTDLRGAVLPGVDLRGVNLYGANFGKADLRGAVLPGVDLRGVNLWGTRLTEADLRGANLNGANLTEADLRGADLRGADLRGADLTRTSLRWARLNGAIGCTRLDMIDPTGLQPVAVMWNDGYHISSGYCSFTVSEALRHWGPNYPGDRLIGDRYLRAVGALEEATP